MLIRRGSGPDKLRAHHEAVTFVKHFMTAGKPTLAISHGPQLLLTADEYKSHRMTAWKTVLGDLRKAGRPAHLHRLGRPGSGCAGGARRRRPDLTLVGGQKSDQALQIDFFPPAAAI